MSEGLDYVPPEAMDNKRWDFSSHELTVQVLSKDQAVIHFTPFDEAKPQEGRQGEAITELILGFDDLVTKFDELSESGEKDVPNTIYSETNYLQAKAFARFGFELDEYNVKRYEEDQARLKKDFDAGYMDEEKYQKVKRMLETKSSIKCKAKTEDIREKVQEMRDKKLVARARKESESRI